MYVLVTRTSLKSMNALSLPLFSSHLLREKKYVSLFSVLSRLKKKKNVLQPTQISSERASFGALCTSCTCKCSRELHCVVMSSFVFHYHVSSLRFNSGGVLSRKKYLVTPSVPCESWMGQAVDSILQICQLTEFKQTKEWEGYPNRFRHLCGTFLPGNMRKDCQEWQQAKRSQRSSFSFKKPANRKTS